MFRQQSQFQKLETQCNQISFAKRTHNTSFRQFEKKNRIFYLHLNEVSQDKQHPVSSIANLAWAIFLENSQLFHNE